MDDGVRQHHGVSTSPIGAIQFYEAGDAVVFRAIGSEREIGPAAARYMADMLYRLADRIEARRRARDVARIADKQVAQRSKDGLARTAGLPPERRQEIARHAAAVRWGKGEAEAAEEGVA